LVRAACTLPGRTLICDKCKLMLEAGFHTPYL
jgi:hypothetical protein